MPPPTVLVVEDDPVILLSTKAQTGDRKSGLDVGADDDVTKPFEPLDLVDRVDALLADRRSR